MWRVVVKEENAIAEDGTLTVMRRAARHDYPFLRSSPQNYCSTTCSIFFTILRKPLPLTC